MLQCEYTLLLPTKLVRPNFYVWLDSAMIVFSSLIVSLWATIYDYISYSKVMLPKQCFHLIMHTDVI